MLRRIHILDYMMCKFFLICGGIIIIVVFGRRGLFSKVAGPECQWERLGNRFSGLLSVQECKRDSVKFRFILPVCPKGWVRRFSGKWFQAIFINATTSSGNKAFPTLFFGACLRNRTGTIEWFLANGNSLALRESSVVN